MSMMVILKTIHQRILPTDPSRWHNIDTLHPSPSGTKPLKECTKSSNWFGNNAEDRVMIIIKPGFGNTMKIFPNQPIGMFECARNPNSKRCQKALNKGAFMVGNW